MYLLDVLAIVDYAMRLVGDIESKCRLSLLIVTDDKCILLVLHPRIGGLVGKGRMFTRFHFEANLLETHHVHVLVDAQPFQVLITVELVNMFDVERYGQKSPCQISGRSNASFLDTGVG